MAIGMGSSMNEPEWETCKLSDDVKLLAEAVVLLHENNHCEPDCVGKCMCGALQVHSNSLDAFKIAKEVLGLKR